MAVVLTASWNKEFCLSKFSCLAYVDLATQVTCACTVCRVGCSIGPTSILTVEQRELLGVVIYDLATSLALESASIPAADRPAA